jgi:nucleotide-binding universal stress UspA family protein
LKTTFYDTSLSPDLARPVYTKREGVNHIVSGATGRSLKNLFIGNIVTSIAKMSKCSVTAIK